MTIRRFIKRQAQKISIGARVRRNQWRAAARQRPQDRMTPDDYRELQDQLNASRGNLGAVQHLVGVEALDRRTKQSEKNKSRGNGKDSRYKLTGLGRTPEWTAKQAEGARQFEERLRSDPAFAKRIREMLERVDKNLDKKRREKRKDYYNYKQHRFYTMEDPFEK